MAYIYLQTGNYGDLLCSSELYGKFDAADVRKAMYATGTRGGLASVFVNKFTSFSGDHTDTKVLRLSEMYLIAAEASYPSSSADALKYVNEVTSRRGAPAIATSGAALLEDIILERRKELAFEGHRYIDLKRLGADAGVPGTDRDATDGANSNAISPLNILLGDYRFTLPIPQAEININPLTRNSKGSLVPSVVI